VAITGEPDDNTGSREFDVCKPLLPAAVYPVDSIEFTHFK